MKQESFFLNSMRALAVAVALATGQMVAVVPPAQALTAGVEYSVVVSRIESDGTLTTVTSTSATADASGKINFNLGNLPTADQVHFVLFQVKDASGKVVRRGIAPAPGKGENNPVGINPLSDVQADALLKAMSDNATDNPIAAAFGLVFIRSENLTSGDIPGISNMMKYAVLSNDGMEAFLLAQGVSRQTLELFKDRLVYNPAAGSKDLSDYVAYFKSAVDKGDEKQLALAGGLMADIFAHAADAAGIDLELLVAAFDAAGAAPGLDAAINSLSVKFQGSVRAAVMGFRGRLASAALNRAYESALSELGGEPGLIQRFNTVFNALVAALQNIDTKYGRYFIDPEGYKNSTGLTDSQIQGKIDSDFEAAWNAFESGIRSTAAEIDDMKQTVATALGVPATSLPPDLGKNTDALGNKVNWPIPQTVAVRWVAQILAEGGRLQYTRDTTPVPSSWPGGKRTDYSAPPYNSYPPSFTALLGMMEDLLILEQVRLEKLFPTPTSTPDSAALKAAMLDFARNMQRLKNGIQGTLDGSTPIGDAKKKALLRLMRQPSIF